MMKLKNKICAYFSVIIVTAPLLGFSTSSTKHPVKSTSNYIVLTANVHGVYVNESGDSNVTMEPDSSLVFKLTNKGAYVIRCTVTTTTNERAGGFWILTPQNLQTKKPAYSSVPYGVENNRYTRVLPNKRQIYVFSGTNNTNTAPHHITFNNALPPSGLPKQSVALTISCNRLLNPYSS